VHGVHNMWRVDTRGGFQSVSAKPSSHADCRRGALQRMAKTSKKPAREGNTKPWGAKAAVKAAVSKKETRYYPAEVQVPFLSAVCGALVWLVLLFEREIERAEMPERRLMGRDDGVERTPHFSPCEGVRRGMRTNLARTSARGSFPFPGPDDPLWALGCADHGGTLRRVSPRPTILLAGCEGEAWQPPQYHQAHQAPEEHRAGQRPHSARRPLQGASSVGLPLSSAPAQPDSRI